jgi:hypothetical protein
MARGYGNALTRHKIAQTEQRQRREMFGWQPAGESVNSPRPVESAVSPLHAGGYCVSTTHKWQGEAKILHIYSGDQKGWLLVRAADGLHVPRVEYVTPVNHTAQPSEMVAPCRALMVIEQPRRKPQWGNFKELTTPDVIALYAFTIGSTVHHSGCYITKVERYENGLFYVTGSKCGFTAEKLTPLRPDPDVCPSCYGTGDMGDTQVDSLNNLKDYRCPSCGGSGKRK